MARSVLLKHQAIVAHNVATHRSCLTCTLEQISDTGSKTFCDAVKRDDASPCEAEYHNITDLAKQVLCCDRIVLAVVEVKATLAVSRGGRNTASRQTQDERDREPSQCQDSGGLLRRLPPRLAFSSLREEANFDLSRNQAPFQ